MEVKINGYKYEEKEAATLKRGLLVEEKALPKKVKDVTLYWQNFEKASLNEPVFYYMEYDKSFPGVFDKFIPNHDVLPCSVFRELDNIFSIHKHSSIGYNEYSDADE